MRRVFTLDDVVILLGMILEGKEVGLRSRVRNTTPFAQKNLDTDAGKCQDELLVPLPSMQGRDNRVEEFEPQHKCFFSHEMKHLIPTNSGSPDGTVCAHLTQRAKLNISS